MTTKTALNDSSNLVLTDSNNTSSNSLLTSTEEAITAATTNTNMSTIIQKSTSTSQNTTNDDDNDNSLSNDKLPPFSFRKKPIDQYSILKNRYSSLCRTISSSSSTNTTISNQQASMMNKEESQVTSEAGNVMFKDVDYDEQIRFPRMNNMNHYTYKKKDSDNKKFGETSEEDEDVEQVNIDKIVDEKISGSHNSSSSVMVVTDDKPEDKKYIPAAFDLNQPLRRYSLPVNNRKSSGNSNHTTTSGSDSQNNDNKQILSQQQEQDEEGEDEEELLREYTSNNYIYQRNLESEQLNQQINNLLEDDKKKFIDYLPKNNRIKNQLSFSKPPLRPTQSQSSIKTNTTTNSTTTSNTVTTNTANPHNPSISSSTGSSDTSASTVSNPTTGTINQVYQLKKPLITPAVLRPNYVDKPYNSIHNQKLGDLLTPIQTNHTFTNSIYTISSPISHTSPEEVDEVETDHIEHDEEYQKAAASIKRSMATNSIHNFSAEPTHIHWKSNNFTSHCMKCFKSFDNSLLSLFYYYLHSNVNNINNSNNGNTSSAASVNHPSSRRSKHHCRFCGLIYCDECLVQNDCEMSNASSASSSTTSMTSIIADTDKVRLDSNARFVIPIYKNIKRLPVENEEVQLIHDSKNYKLFKICLKCYAIYKSLLNEINSAQSTSSSSSSLNNHPTSSSTITSINAKILKYSPFIYVENPYVDNMKLQQGQAANNRNNKRKLSVQSPTAANLISNYTSSSGLSSGSNSLKPHTKQDDERRPSMVGEVPSDWTWSSF
ncbi:hypothetical protein DFJ63DRAFT_313425 [Scheffersomyces coipomensis]|uniref:uncharacterized protein n=1 Tax=Scheffersomyces coipomensis TaxID=1788519 RepID=UPI00315CD359